MRVAGALGKARGQTPCGDYADAQRAGLPALWSAGGPVLVLRPRRAAWPRRAAPNAEWRAERWRYLDPRGGHAVCRRGRVAVPNGG